jgi:hypothetical protein
MFTDTALPQDWPTNPFYEQPADLSRDDIFTLAGFTMCGHGLGKAVRERFVALAADLLKKHGLRAFEMPKRAAAIHEAGHTVANAALGVRTTNVLIDPINRGGKLLWIGFTDAPELAFLDTPSARVSFERLLARSRITYAGLAAELLFAGDDKREGSSIDELMMSQILAEQAASLVETSAERLWRDEVATWCHSQLYRNRAAHAEIAAALMKRGRLKGKVLRELCAKVSPPDEVFPDIQDHTSQLTDAGILPSEEDYAA